MHIEEPASRAGYIFGQVLSMIVVGSPLESVE